MQLKLCKTLFLSHLNNVIFPLDYFPCSNNISYV
jgi:hypothetical protein